MVDFQPFQALRYSSRAGDAGAVLAPPFDVIYPDERAQLIERSPHNVVRLELPQGDDPYAEAAATLREWRAAKVIVQDDAPRFYHYLQEFDHAGGRVRRAAAFGRLRLEPWERGAVLPHEETMRGPKEDRLQLLRHLHTQVSSIFVLCRDDDGAVGRHLSSEGAPLLDATTPDGEHHVLSAIEGDAAEGLAAALRKRPAYILDGHHRYETALAYRDERRAEAGAWTGDEPENFLMVALTPADDPGLVLLPIHRLVRPARPPEHVLQQLERFFTINDVTPPGGQIELPQLLERVAAAGRSSTAFAALGLARGRAHLLTLRDANAVRALMPEQSETWQALDTAVLEYAVLREVLGVESDAEVHYTADGERAVREIETGGWPLAFLMNATRVEQILAIADARERMPPKSTYFYPKLATGLVLNLFE